MPNFEGLGIDACHRCGVVGAGIDREHLVWCRWLTAVTGPLSRAVDSIGGAMRSLSSQVAEAEGKCLRESKAANNRLDTQGQVLHEYRRQIDRGEEKLVNLSKAVGDNRELMERIGKRRPVTEHYLDPQETLGISRWVECEAYCRCPREHRTTEASFVYQFDKEFTKRVEEKLAGLTDRLASLGGEVSGLNRDMDRVKGRVVDAEETLKNLSRDLDRRLESFNERVRQIEAAGLRHQVERMHGWPSQAGPCTKQLKCEGLEGHAGFCQDSRGCKLGGGGSESVVVLIHRFDGRWEECRGSWLGTRDCKIAAAPHAWVTGMTVPR